MDAPRPAAPRTRRPVWMWWFVGVERRAAHPLIPLGWFARRGFAVSVVVSFFMHSKFDHKLLSFWFIAGLFFGALVVLALMFLFDLSHPIDYATSLLRPLEDVLPAD